MKAIAKLVAKCPEMWMTLKSQQNQFKLKSKSYAMAKALEKKSERIKYELATEQ